MQSNTREEILERGVDRGDLYKYTDKKSGRVVFANFSIASEVLFYELEVNTWSFWYELMDMAFFVCKWVFIILVLYLTLLKTSPEITQLLKDDVCTQPIFHESI